MADDGEIDKEEEYSKLSDISDNLKSIIKSPARVFCGGKARELPTLPGLEVQGVGDLSLPLTQTEAERLAAVGTQPPSGNGEKRKKKKKEEAPIQFDSSQFCIKNSQWNQKLYKLVRGAMKELGVSPEHVSAKNPKLLLYTPGCSFKKQKDTKKEEGMFATLVVQFPSRFTGGCFVMKHAGRDDRLYLGEGGKGGKGKGRKGKGRKGGGAYGCYYVCHYADCEHEVESVTSGSRLVLTYSLCYSVSQPPLSIPSLKAFNDLEWSLSHLPPSQTFFVYYPTHDYDWDDLSSLGVKALEGEDKQVVKAIFNAGGRAGKEENGWELLFFEVEKSQQECVGDYIGQWRFAFSNWISHEESAVAVREKNEDVSWVAECYHWDDWNVSDDDGPEEWEDERVLLDGGFEWGEPSETEEDKFDEYGPREATYRVHVFIFFKSENKAQILCDLKFDSMLEKVQKDSSFVPFFFSYLNTTPSRQLTAKQFKLLLPCLPPIPDQLSSPPSPSPYYDTLLKRVAPSGADLSFSNDAIGNLLLYFCCFCGESVKKGVRSLVKWIVESLVWDTETIYPHANFLLALQKNCSFYSKGMCQRDMKALIQKKRFRGGGWNGLVSKEDLRVLMEKYVETSKSLWGSDWESSGGLMIFFSGYLGKMKESHSLAAKASSGDVQDQLKSNEILKNIVDILTLLLPFTSTLKTFYSEYVAIYINGLTTLINHLRSLPPIDVPSTWAFPKAQHKINIIQSALRSPRQEEKIVLGGGIAYASKYAECEKTDEDVILREGYSAVVESFGLSGGAGIHIKKTMTYINILQKKKEDRETALSQAQQDLQFYSSASSSAPSLEIAPSTAPFPTPSPTPSSTPSPNPSLKRTFSGSQPKVDKRCRID